MKATKINLRKVPLLTGLAMRSGGESSLPRKIHTNRNGLGKAGDEHLPDGTEGFKAVHGDLKKVTIDEKELLAELRQLEAGKWKKVYKDGYDASEKSISLPYFQSRSGKIFNFKVKPGHSNR